MGRAVQSFLEQVSDQTQRSLLKAKVIYKSIEYKWFKAS